MNANLTEPAILTAKTFFFRPSSNASGRRRNESRQHSIVIGFLEGLGFSILRADDEISVGVLNHESLGRIEVEFYYSESCKNVYRRLSVTRNGKVSNITLLRKLYK